MHENSIPLTLGCCPFRHFFSVCYVINVVSISSFEAIAQSEKIDIIIKVDKSLTLFTKC